MPMKAPEFIEADLIEEKQAEAVALADESVREAVTPIPEAVNTVDWTTELRAQLKAELLAELKRDLPAAPPVAQGTIPIDLPKNQDIKPPSFKKHYRSETYPELVMQKLDMTALDRGERPQSNPLPGETINFRMTHLYTNDDDTIRQLEWVLRERVGTGSFYEDDGVGVYECTAGCDYKTASLTGFKVHMLSRHQIEVGL